MNFEQFFYSVKNRISEHQCVFPSINKIILLCIIKTKYFGAKKSSNAGSTFPFEQNFLGTEICPDASKIIIGR